MGNDEKQTVIVIGGGISGLTSACYLAKAGYQVKIFEKNTEIGGRCRQWIGNESNNEINRRFDGDFVFDMGPTWYWMPDIIKRFFDDFKHLINDQDMYRLIRIKDSYQILFSDSSQIMGSYLDMKQYFESIEPGSAKQLERFIKENGEKYRIAINEYLDKPLISLLEVIRIRALSDFLKLDPLATHAERIRESFKDPRLRKIMEWPVIFLGSAPEKISAMYGLLVHSAIMQGTYYPDGGMYQIIRSIKRILDKSSVQIVTDREIVGVSVDDRNSICGITDCNGNRFSADHYVVACDYHHFESLLEPNHRMYTDKYWDTREMSPSALLFYLGFDRKLDNLIHHNLFFQNDFQKQIDAIYSDPKYISDPLFYVAIPSKTDPSVIPDKCCENVYVLVPLASGLKEDQDMNRQLFETVIKELEKQTNIKQLINHLIYKKTYCLNDFKTDYNAYKGNAYGLSNVLTQTAFGKPSQKSTKLNNLVSCGQLTGPGPGIPPCILSGKSAATLIIDDRNQRYKVFDTVLDVAFSPIIYITYLVKEFFVLLTYQWVTFMNRLAGKF